MRNGKKTGFTLVEILIASAILSILTFIGYKIFIAMSYSFKKGSWSLTAQNKLRNGLGFIREEMQKATYRTKVGPGGSEITEAGHKMRLNSNEEITADADLAKWHICIPFISNDSDSPGAIYECELKYTDGDIVYKKILDEGSDPANKERPLANFTVIRDVSNIKITVQDFDPDNEQSGSLISFNVTVSHPDEKNFKHTKVHNQTGAKVEVDVLRDL
ncbi:MAG: PilW family protein [Candidatus Rifleibacteriota bacterium]